MLTELYEYALSHQLAARPGFKPKRPKGYLLLSQEGAFLGVDLRGKDAPAVMAPDVGAAANGTRFCNPLIEKAGIPLNMVNDPVKDKNVPTKHAFFLAALDSGAEHEPMFAVVAKALRSEETLEAMRAGLAEHKLKPSDPVGFQVDGQPVEQSERYLDWWADFRKQFLPAPSGVMPRCLITGELAPALLTVPKVSGLMAVGGHTSGDAFLCFDKDAFQSYGLKQSANAPVSETAMTAVNAALTELIREAKVLGNAKLVHWYSAPITEEEDLIPVILGDQLAPPAGEEDPADPGGEADALRAARALIQSLHDGSRPEALNARYYILPLSGAKGRMMVRGWYEGSYETLYDNVTRWFDDLRLVLWNGKGTTRPPKLKALCICLLRPGGDPQKVWERLDKELPNLLNRVLYAIINGAPLPDEAASRALMRLRSAMLASGRDDNKSSTAPSAGETLVFQLLKAWLRRKQRLKGEENLMEERFSEQGRDVAYYCGALMAVYAAIQSKAMPEVGVGVVERYYAAASSSPGFVIGKLSQLAQYHLAKLDKGLAVYYEKRLSELYCRIGTQKIPTMLTLEQQAEFALGYYQQRAALYTSNKEA